MPQQNEWRERVELLLEGGGHLPGASEIIEVRHKVISCSVTKRKENAQVIGQLQLFVYYRFARSPKIRGHGVEVPWHAEVSVPGTVKGPLEVEVIDVRHEHSFDLATEQFRHTMHIIFEVFAIEQDRSLHSANSQPAQPGPLPEWARDAADDLMRSQHPAAAITPPWLRDVEPERDQPKLGQAQGSFTRDGQTYEGPAPDWPKGISLELIEKTLEGEPVALGSTAAATVHIDLAEPGQDTATPSMAASIAAPAPAAPEPAKSPAMSTTLPVSAVAQEDIKPANSLTDRPVAPLAVARLLHGSTEKEEPQMSTPDAFAESVNGAPTEENTCRKPENGPNADAAAAHAESSVPQTAPHETQQAPMQEVQQEALRVETQAAPASTPQEQTTSDVVADAAQEEPVPISQEQESAPPEPQTKPDVLVWRPFPKTGLP